MAGEIRKAYRVLQIDSDPTSESLRTLTVELAGSGRSECWTFRLPDWKSDLVVGDMFVVVAGEGE